MKENLVVDDLNCGGVLVGKHIAKITSEMAYLSSVDVEHTSVA